MKVEYTTHARQHSSFSQDSFSQDPNRWLSTGEVGANQLVRSGCRGSAQTARPYITGGTNALARDAAPGSTVLTSILCAEGATHVMANPERNRDLRIMLERSADLPHNGVALRPELCRAFSPDFGENRSQGVALVYCRAFGAPEGAGQPRFVQSFLWGWFSDHATCATGGLSIL